MVRRVLVVLALAVVPFIGISAALVPGASATPGPSAQQCMNGGWQTLTDASGQPFKNQGQCISYLIHHPVSLADLAGPFSGTTSVGGGTVVCSLVEQLFDATYLGSSAVGSVALHLDGCFNVDFPFTYTGRFTIATSVGTLAGSANGPVSSPPFPPSVPDFELTLTVLSGTGAFAGTIGTIHVSILWPPPFGPPVTGSVSVP